MLACSCCIGVIGRTVWLHYVCSMNKSILTISFYRIGLLQITVNLVWINLVKWWFNYQLANAIKYHSNCTGELLCFLAWVVKNVKIRIVHKLGTH